MTTETMKELCEKLKIESIYDDLRDITDEQLAERIRLMDEWDYGLVKELCRHADLEEEWDDAEEMEPIVYKAAEKLGVEVL